MEEPTIQNVFFQQIKDRLPSHLALVDEIADTLDISNDSAYRRIRGETSLGFEEIAALAAKHGISLDGLAGSNSDTVAFRYQPLHEEMFSFEEYMASVLADTRKIEQMDGATMTYVANDIPFFQLFGVHEVASFKLFVWTKTILNYSEHKGKKFTMLEGFSDRVRELGNQLIESYCNIPSIEVFHSGSLDSTLNQLEYYYVSGLFEKKGDALVLCDKLSELVEHMQRQAEVEVKFPFGKELPEGTLELRRGNYQLYYNEVLHTDNTILASCGDFKMAYLTNNGHNSLMTTNPVFHDNAERAVKNLLSKSSLVSGTSEKERNRIFMLYQDKIDQMRAIIK
ncbi:MAG: hypothetical protein JKY52_00670 [Flavobacteriales bacterium]|nr:hypothetical protein [Flavobacteriales bacterium]